MGSITPRVRQIDVPPEARALSTLAHIDYEDAFLVDTSDAPEQSATEWARAMLDHAPVALRAKLWGAWMLLGLRLGPPRSEQRILGWELRRSAQDVALLGARSRIGMPAELLVQLEPGTLLFSTFVQKDNLLARAAWAAIDGVHRPIVGHVLEQGRRRMVEPCAGATSS